MIEITTNYFTYSSYVNSLALCQTHPQGSARPSLRAEQVAQTRGALVRAGRRLFGDNGFKATSVDDLAREARVTTGALYHHFPTKSDLFEAVFEQAHTDLMAEATQPRTAPPTASTSSRAASTRSSTVSCRPICSGSC